MSLPYIILLGFALSIDAMIVAFSNGLIFNNRRTINSLKLSLTVGFFQFIMPIIGFYFVEPVQQYAKPYSHWLVFVIFIVLGIKFILDSQKEHVILKHDFSLGYMMTVGIATSIDALFAGVSLSFSGVGIIFPSLVIGIITFINSILGFWSANLIKRISPRRMQILGGAILILLGIKYVLSYSLQ